MSSTVWRAAAGTAVLGLTFVASGPAVAQADEAAMQVAVAPTPSPTLGSTNSTPPEQPGNADSSPRDYDSAVLVVVAAVIVVAIVGGGTFFLVRTRRIDLTQRNAPAEREHHHQ
jgi:uncharacterized protein HemX